MRSWTRPLVGRFDELAKLTRLLQAAANGSGGAMFLVGEPGAGKTRLLEAASSAAEEAAVTVRIGRTSELEAQRALGAALDAFGLRLEQLAGRTAATRMVLEAGAPAAARFLLVDRLVELVEAECAHHPLMLAIEDLHWADPATVGWLHALVARTADLPLAVVATTRPLTTGSPAGRLLDLPHTTRLDLGPLAVNEVRTLVDAVLGDRDAGERLQAALREAAGNPLLVLAVLDAAGHGGGTDGGPIAARLCELGTETAAVLRTAAVLGTTVRLPDLATVLGTGLADLLPHIDAAAAAGFLVPRADGFAFRHELHRQAVLTRLAAGSLAALHLQAARALAASGVPAVDLAEHFARGAQPGDREAADWLRRAALDMVAAAPAGALRLVDVALPLCGTAPPASLLLVRVRALAGTGRTDEAELLARSLLHEDLNPDMEAALRRELAFAAFVGRRTAECVDEIERCEKLAAAPGARARVSGEVAFARLMALDDLGAAESAQRAIADGRRCGDVAAQVAGGVVLTYLDLFALRIPESRARARAVTRLAELPGAADAHVFQPWFAAALVALETDDLRGVAGYAHRGRQVAIERGSGWAVPGHDAVSAFGALRAGDLDDALAMADAVLGCREGVDGLGVMVWCHAFRAQVHLHRGELDAAAAALSAADGMPTTGRAQFGVEQVQIARAQLLELRGDPAAACTALTQVWDLFTATGLRAPLPAIGIPLARLAAVTGDRRRCADVAATLTEAAADSGVPSFSAIALLAAAWRDGDPDSALAAAAAATRTPRKPLAATAYRDAAALLRARGRRSEADDTAAEAVRRWSALDAFAEAAACTRISRTARPPDPRPRFGVALTPTERKVVALVSDGLANAKIADRLGVSRRTVETHVGSAYRKLDVDSRVTLARMAMSHGISDKA